MENYLPDLSNIWPEWKAVKKLGEGSFGKVFKCERSEYGINTECAVKIVSIPQNESEINAVRAECTSEESVKAHFKEIVDDFANEIKIMVDLKGAPNIVTVENYKIVEREEGIGWDIYIRMEYLTAFTDFARKNTFTEKAVAKLASDICEALEICAGKNIIHRDIKPDNIFIDSFGNYKIGDFGVARKLENASLAMSKKGTYTYMAPEVYKGEAYDNRADIYSLGMVMFRLLNRGKDPFTNPQADMVTRSERENALVMRMNGHNLPAPIDASVDMAKIIIKACAFNPNYRFATPTDFKKALNAFMSNTSTSPELSVSVPAGMNEYSASRSNSAPLFGNSVAASAGATTVATAPSVQAPVQQRPVQQIPVQQQMPVQQRPVQQQMPMQQMPVQQMPVQPAPQKKKSKKGIVIAIIAFLLAAAIGVGVYFILQSKDNTKDPDKPKNTEEIIASIKIDYLDNKITYDEATDSLDKYINGNDSEAKSNAEAVLEEIEEVKPYRDMHLSAIDSISAGEYIIALDTLYNIPSDYPQFDEVDSLISSAKEDYKASVFTTVDEYIAGAGFGEAKALLDTLSDYVNDDEVTQAYDKIHSAELSYYYSNQQVYVEAGSEELFYGTDGQYRVRVNIKNNTDKTTYKVVLSCLEFNSDGSPTYRTTYTQTYDNNHRLNTTDAIAPYSTFDMTAEDTAWPDVTAGTANVIVCVDYVEFTDGSTWYNPYHSLCLDEYNASYSDWLNKGY